MKSYNSAVPFGIAAALLAAVPLAFADHSAGGGVENAHTDTEAPVTVQTAAAHADCSVIENLMLGSRGEEVECLQAELIGHGLLAISAPTGYFGSLTRHAVMEWQRENGVPATGFFGSLSREEFGHTKSTTSAAPAMHAHEPVDVSAWPSEPSVAITLHPDSMSGWNLEILPQHFRFAPEHVNGAVVANEGHAHLYVNGKKIGRVYGLWQHLPADIFLTGSNEVVVTLNANDHSDLAHEGVRIEAKATVTK